MTDRVSLNTPDTWSGPALALGTVDEIVLSGAVHIEMMSHHVAYIRIQHPSGAAFVGRVVARATTAAERRDILRHDEDRLVDQLRQLLPSRWSRTWWAVSWWRRPAAVWRSWRDAVDRARAVLLITVDEDSDIDNDWETPR